MSKNSYFVFTREDIPMVQNEVDTLKAVLDPVISKLHKYALECSIDDVDIPELAKILVCNETDAKAYIKAYHEYHIGINVLTSLATVGKCSIRAVV